MFKQPSDHITASVLFLSIFAVLLQSRNAQNSNLPLFLTQSTIKFKSAIYSPDYSNQQSVAFLSFVNSVLRNITLALSSQNIVAINGNITELRNGSVIADVVGVVSFIRDDITELSSILSSIVKQSLYDVNIDSIVVYYFYSGEAVFANIDTSRNSSTFSDYLLVSLGGTIFTKLLTLGIHMVNTLPFLYQVTVNNETALQLVANATFNMFSLSDDLISLQESTMNIFKSELIGVTVRWVTLTRPSNNSATKSPANKRSVTSAVPIEAWKIVLPSVSLLFILVTVILIIMVLRLKEEVDPYSIPKGEYSSGVEVNTYSDCKDVTSYSNEIKENA